MPITRHDVVDFIARWLHSHTVPYLPQFSMFLSSHILKPGKTIISSLSTQAPKDEYFGLDYGRILGLFMFNVPTFCLILFNSSVIPSIVGNTLPSILRSFNTNRNTCLSNKNHTSLRSNYRHFSGQSRTDGP